MQQEKFQMVRILIAFAIALLSAAMPANAAALPDLTGLPWKLQSIKGYDWGGQRSPSMTFTLSAGRNLSGFSGCNRFFGEYELLPEGRIKVSVQGVTMMACVTEAMGLEQRFLNSLRDVALYEMAPDGTLTLWSEDGGAVLTFQQKQS
jgi:heat shock protein HslJ